MHNLKQFVCSLLICLVCFVGTSLSAQTTAEDMVSLEFTALSWGNQLIRGLQYVSDQETHSLDIYYRGFTVPRIYHGSQTLIFFRENQILDSGEIVRVPVGTVALPVDAGEVLLIFIRDPDNDEELYQIIPINRDRSNFPNGSYQIYNLSDYIIIGKVGSEKFNLEKHENSIVKLSLQETAAIEVKFACADEDGWKLAYSSLWGHNIYKRVNIFIVNSGDSVNPVAVRKFQEQLKN